MGWDRLASEVGPSTVPQPTGDSPPDNLDLDSFLEELDGFDSLGGDLGDDLADQPLSSFGEPLSSIDSYLPSDFYFPLDARDSSPLYSETECMTSPPDTTSNRLEESSPRVLPKKRKAKAKPERCTHPTPLSLVGQRVAQIKKLIGRLTQMA